MSEKPKARLTLAFSYVFQIIKLEKSEKGSLNVETCSNKSVGENVKRTLVTDKRRGDAPFVAL